VYSYSDGICLNYVVCRHFSVYPIRANTLKESLNIYRKDHMSETDKNEDVSVYECMSDCQI
jgi:hypothetical protein